MSVNAIEPADAQPVAQTQNSELIYRLEDRPPRRLSAIDS